MVASTPLPEDDVPWTRLAAHGLCVVDDRILLVRLSPDLLNAGLWTLPGGGVEWGEAPEDAVVREVREETGLEATAAALAGVWSTTYQRSEARPYAPLHFVSVIYRLRVAEGELVHEIGGSTDRAAWVPWAGLGDRRLAGITRFGLGLLSGPGEGVGAAGDEVVSP
jgi:8-oxo-dGTP diphosphatase